MRGVRASILTWAAVAVLIGACGTYAIPVESPSPEVSGSPQISPTGTPSPILRLLSQGSSTIRGTFMFDLELGVESQPGSADVWWEQVDSVRRYLAPQNGTVLAPTSFGSFSAIPPEQLSGQRFSTQPLDGSNASTNVLTAGRIVAFKTRHGHLGKLRIDIYGYNLGITWVTYV